MWHCGIGRAFSPFGRVDVLSRGAAPVWYGTGLWPLLFAPVWYGTGLWPMLFAPVWYGTGPLALAGGVSIFCGGPTARRYHTPTRCQPHGKCPIEKLARAIRKGHTCTCGQKTTQKKATIAGSLFPSEREMSQPSLEPVEVAFAGVLRVKRNLFLLRFALERALRLSFWAGVSKERRRRISSMIPSVSILLLRRLRARSIGSPFLISTSGIVNDMSFRRGYHPLWAESR